VITTSIEHPSVAQPMKALEEMGYEVTYLPVNSDATVSVNDVRKALRPDTCIVSVMAVNNEVGAINPIEEIAEMVKKESHAFFHTDLTQAIGKVDIDMKNIDLASVSAHKLHGLKGSGILVKKRHVPFIPLINGGEQEGWYKNPDSDVPDYYGRWWTSWGFICKGGGWDVNC
jgi:cysteine desulfurase